MTADAGDNSGMEMEEEERPDVGGAPAQDAHSNPLPVHSAQVRLVAVQYL